MTETMQRVLTLADGSRATLRLTPSIWRAVEQLAAVQSQRWTAWMRDLIATMPADRNNMHAAIREHVTALLLEHSTLNLFEDRAAQLAGLPPAVLACASTLDDQQLEDDLAASTLDGEPVDLAAFSIVSGSDQFGRACIWLRNGLRNGWHYAIPLQTTIAEQAARLGNADWRKGAAA